MFCGFRFPIDTIFGYLNNVSPIRTHVLDLIRIIVTENRIVCNKGVRIAFSHIK